MKILNEKYKIEKIIFPTASLVKEVKILYVECFMNYYQNATMENYVNENVNIVTFYQTNIAGCATINPFNYKEKSWVNLILIGVKAEFRGKGLGSFIIDYLKERFDAIAIYSDKSDTVLNYYFNRGFKRSGNQLNEGLYKHVEYERDAVFLTWKYGE